MRVATRRLRAAIDFFVDVLPVRARALRSELTWLAGVLGQVRDLDVQIDRMDGMDGWAAWAPTGDAVGSPLEDLRTLLLTQHGTARRDLLDALDSPRWERLASGLTAMVQHSPSRRSPAARLPAAAALPDLVTVRHQAVVKAARRAKRSGVASDFHRLRIRCKRLRYSLEFTAGVYGARTERFTRKLAKLQDALGLMQDAEVATTRLLALATGASAGQSDDVQSDDSQPGAGLPPATVFAMGAVAEHYRVESLELLEQMPRHLTVLQGKEWDDLASHMGRRRLEAMATIPAPRPSRPLAGALAATTAPLVPAPAPPAPMPLTSTAATAPAADRTTPADAALSTWPDTAWEPPATAETASGEG